MADFYILMAKTAQVRRQIVEVVLKGLPIRPHFALSLENAKVVCVFIEFSPCIQNSLENSCESNTNILALHTTAAEDDGEVLPMIKFDITDELTELQKDLAFLLFIQSEETNNVEQFIDVSYFL